MTLSTYITFNHIAQTAKKNLFQIEIINTIFWMLKPSLQRSKEHFDFQLSLYVKSLCCSY